MESITHIRTSRKTYYGAILLSFLFVLYDVFATKKSLTETVSGIIGIICISVVLYSLYKLFFGKGKIILTESAFKVEGYGWTNWEELHAVYPFVEQDTENGSHHYIHFRLVDGTDLSVRSEHLEMTFEEIAELVSRYKADFQNKKQ